MNGPESLVSLISAMLNVRGVKSIPSGQLQEGRDKRQMERQTEHMDAVSFKSKQPQPGQEQTKELPNWF